jgi:hypothetical protein
MLLQYAKFADVALEKDSAALLEHRLQDLAINLKQGASSLYMPLYNLLQIELGILQKYLDNYLARG